MKKLPVEKLKPGMIAAEDIITKKGQILVQKGTVLDNTLITRLAFYQISALAVDNPAPQPSTPVQQNPQFSMQGMPQQNPNQVALQPAMQSMPTQNPNFSNTNSSEQDKYVSDALSTTTRILMSDENHNAQVIYAKMLGSLKENFNNIITGKFSAVTKNSLLAEAGQLFQSHSSVKLFDLLRTLRGNDDTVYAHSINVGMIARVLGKWLKMSNDDLDTLTIAGFLHDIGKLTIPPEVLTKTGKLTDEEFAKIRKHPLNSYKILSTIPNIDKRILYAALQHHERYDGSGYPDHLKGDRIDDFAAIMAIADVYDAMTASRSYRSAKCAFEVIDDFEKDGFQKYNAKFIMTFLQHIADYYNNSVVMLSNEQTARIIYINSQALSRPMVKLNSGDIIDLSKERELHIVSTM